MVHGAFAHGGGRRNYHIARLPIIFDVSAHPIQPRLDFEATMHVRRLATPRKMRTHKHPTKH
eukprot:8976494-Pyramimonas_sp.AAC.1